MKLEKILLISTLSLTLTACGGGNKKETATATKENTKVENVKEEKKEDNIEYKLIHGVISGDVKTVYVKLEDYSDEKAELLYKQLIEEYRPLNFKMLNVSIYDGTFNEPLEATPKNTFERTTYSFNYQTGESI